MEENRVSTRDFGACLIVGILLMSLVIMALQLRSTQDRLDQLEKGISEQATSQQAQIDSIQVSIDGIASYTDALNKDIEKLGQDLNETRQVQRNTNTALTRLRKQKEELEKRFEEELELRRQRLAEMRANRSEPSGSWSDVGGVLLTAYEWTGHPCANGNWPTPGYTVASNDYPLGTRIYIEGLGEFVVEDTGGMGSGVIDIYMGDVETCYQFGVQHGNIRVIED